MFGIHFPPPSCGRVKLLWNSNSRWGPIVYISNLNKTWRREINLLKVRVSSNVDHPLSGNNKACRSARCCCPQCQQTVIIKVSSRPVGEEMERSWFRKGNRLYLLPSSRTSSWISKCCRLGNRLSGYRPPTNWQSLPRILWWVDHIQIYSSRCKGQDETYRNRSCESRVL